MDLYNAPANLFVAGFLGSPKMNLLAVTVSANDGSGLHVRSRDGGARFALGHAGASAPAVGTQATLGFRPDQVELLRVDNVVSEHAKREGRTLENLGIDPVAMASVVPSYLWRFRRAGQFAEQTDDRQQTTEGGA